ncbi:uncharacterized protein LOC123697563 [Colias croceus]|uniref:uncharacterized protein LOC123697563 n=1 Tax=Colias crocea TaxID=72248 RepID=UPI001E280350|nr:uncharacterized protein LOC123697563 [Colias croceus]
MAKSESKCRCCYVETMCGRSLRDGVVFVGVISLCTSLIILLSSTTCVIVIANTQELFNNRPMIAMNLIFSLVASCISSYQILISALLLWQALGKTNRYLCSLWYISHISILVIYFILFGSRGYVCITQNHNLMAFITISIGILYEGVFIYFAVVVNSYMHSINGVRYL